MMTMLTEFLDFAATSDAIWDKKLLLDFSQRSYPLETLGRSRDIVRADTYLHWISWFAEGLVDPARVAGRYDSYGELFQACLQCVAERFRDLTADERRPLASAIAHYLQFRADVLASERQRQRLTTSQKIELVKLAGVPPRCWITGLPFSTTAVDSFLEMGEEEDDERSVLGRPVFVDIYRPIGLQPRDLQIEVDHVFPVARGGENSDNLRLACGWANVFKAQHVSLYDVAGGVRIVRVRKGPTHLPASLPQPFWVVRLLATRRRCEDPSGCDATVENAELTVAPIFPGGAPTPTNLRVVCDKHDPIAAERLVPRTIAAAAWGKD